MIIKVTFSRPKKVNVEEFGNFGSQIPSNIPHTQESLVPEMNLLIILYGKMCKIRKAGKYTQKSLNASNNVITMVQIKLYILLKCEIIKFI